MSDVVKFIFYYGPGTVQTNEMGADLSDFQYVEVPLTAPKTWSVSQLTDWLTGCLGLILKHTPSVFMHCGPGQVQTFTFI